MVCGMPVGKASGPHWKGCGATGPGVEGWQEVTSSYLWIAADFLFF